MKIITWNINSVRLRMPLLLKLMAQENPDVICLQETKTPDEHFPREAIEQAGYSHIHFTGMKGYNGVAILSKHPLENPKIYARCGQEDCRHISVTVHSENFSQFTLHNLYIPAGGYEADPIGNPKFQHKLDFVDELVTFFDEHHTKDENIIAVGDLNIAPYENDVWSHKQLLKVVSHTPAETTRMANMREGLNWVDTARHFVPMDEKLYTWWSYRNKDWKKSNRGRRLDHIWVTQSLKDKLKSHSVLREARDWERPSDHVPLVLELEP